MNKIHYDGFISYRHNERDSAVAKQIQDGLEHFRIPKIIKEKYHKERFERIFRDEEELNTGADLAEKIEVALDNSDYLIIICSPEYIKSKWCLLEVETFLKKHDLDHVLCVLSDGEPPVIFPEALLKKGEPLACDYRMDFKEAKRSQLPKLVSTMLGCSYDELIMRQERYRRKRLFISLSIIASLVFIAFSYLLYSNARIRENYNEALKNESKVLAKESLDCFENKDRLSAIETALKALPDEKLNRPLTDEAQFALSKAVYAYETPYQLAQTWHIDRPGDIIEFFISRDKQYLIYLDKSKTIYCVDLKERKTVVSFKPDVSDFSNIHEGSDHQLIAYANGSVFAYDCLNGDLKWSTPLKYQTIAISHLSNNQKYIGASDALAMQIMDTKGTPLESYPLPDDYDGYIRDFIWSKDDSLIAVDIRVASLGYRYAIFDRRNYAFSSFDDLYQGILYSGFGDDDTLYVLEDKRNEYSNDIKDVRSSYYGSYILHAYKKDHKVFETAITSNSIIDDIEIFSRQDGNITLVLGNEVYLLDSKGTIIKRYSVDGIISKVFEHNDEFLLFACNNGYQGALFLENGDSSLNRSFPENFESIIYNETGDKKTSYFVLKEGNIEVYENLYDDSICYYDDHQGFDYPISEKLIEGNKIVIKSEKEISIFDSDQRKAIASFKLDSDKYYHLLKLYGNSLYVMNCEGTDGSCYLLSIDADNGSLLDKTLLEYKDFYVYAEFLKYPLSKSEEIFTDEFYSDPSCITCYDHKLYYHNYDNPNLIYIYDLLNKKQDVVKVSLDSWLLVNNLNYYYPSELLVLDKGNTIYTTVYDISKADPVSSRHGALIDLTDGSMKLLDEIPSEGFDAYGKDDHLLYSGEDHLNVIDIKTMENKSISYLSEKAITFMYEKGKLYCVYPNNELRIYQDEKEIRRITLSAGDTLLSSNKSIRMNIIDNELFVSINNSLNVINLDSDSSSVLCGLNDKVLGYIGDRFIVYGYDETKEDIRYYLGEYKRHDVQELIDIGNNQLEHFN